MVSLRRTQSLYIIVLILCSDLYECRRTSIRRQPPDTNLHNDQQTTSQEKNPTSSLSRLTSIDLEPDSSPSNNVLEQNSATVSSRTSHSKDSDSSTDDNTLRPENESFSIFNIFNMDNGLFGVFNRVRRMVEDFGGFAKESDQQWRQVLGALEGFDDILRSTIPEVDRFECVQRVMCEMSTPNNPANTGPGSILADLFGGGNSGGPSIQTLQQQFLQDPTQQFAQFGTNALQFNGQQGGQFFQPQTQFVSPQVVQSQLQFGQPQFPQQLAAFPQQTFVQGQTPFFREENALRRNEASEDSATTVLKAAASHHTDGPRVPTHYNQAHHNQPGKRVLVRRRRKNFFQRLFGLRRRRRSTDEDSNDEGTSRQGRGLFDSFISGWTNNRFFGILDQMAERYSFYPYTHAAFMGMTRGAGSCKSLYPECPSTPEDMINVINNLHRHYPNGFPFKDSIPWPFNQFLP